MLELSKAGKPVLWWLKHGKIVWIGIYFRVVKIFDNLSMAIEARWFDTDLLVNGNSL